MQRMVIEPGARPTLIARPEEVFRSHSGTDAESSLLSSTFASAATTNTKAATTFSREQFKSGPQQTPVELPSWNAAEALLQLKLALDDIPRLRPATVQRRNERSSVPLKPTLERLYEDPTAASESPLTSHSSSTLPKTVFMPPIVRYSSAYVASSPSSPSDYAQRTLCSIQDVCTRLEKQLGEVNDTRENVALAADLQWAYVMRSLQEPEFVTQLQRRADAAIREKEYTYRINEFLNAELHKRGVPPELAREGFGSFLGKVRQSRIMLENYLKAQRALSTLSPMLEAAAARAVCLRDVALLVAPEATSGLENMKRGAVELLAQVKQDTCLLRTNTEAMQRRLDTLNTLLKTVPQG